MRGTVLLADALVLVPAVLAFARTTGAAKRSLALVLILLYPGLIIIDNGHFQVQPLNNIFFLNWNYTLKGTVLLKKMAPSFSMVGTHGLFYSWLFFLKIIISFRHHHNFYSLRCENVRGKYSSLIFFTQRE